MPQNGNITIEDGASTPADHVFSPTGIDGNNVASFTERTDGVLIGEPRLSVFVRPVTKGQTTRKVVVSLSQPKRSTSPTGELIVEYENLAKAELTASATSSTQDRKNLRVLLANALLNTAVGTAIDNHESFW